MLLIESPFKYLVIVIQFGLVVELQPILFHFDASSDVPEQSVGGWLAYVVHNGFGSDLLIVTRIKRKCRSTCHSISH